MTQAPQQPQERTYETKAFGGRIGRDFELRTTQNGNIVCNIDVVMDHMNKEATWVRVTYWGTNAQLASDWLKKGDAISGIGRFYFGTPYVNAQGQTKTPLEAQGLVLNLDASTVLGLITAVIDKKILTTLEKKPEQPVQAQPAPAPVAPQPQPAQEPQQDDVASLFINSSDLPF